MIPRIAQRGSSFKGAGQYYLHDKEASTKERVAWTLTHNVPTEDPELAMKWMAHTAIHRNKLKQDAGVPLTGRRSSDQPVYAFSLAWQPEQSPSKEHMVELAFDALDLLGLKEHEAVFVAHNDTSHPHVHVITNLVNPNNGKTLRPQNDRLKFSEWAETYEKEHGKVYCHERVVNNEIRRGGQKVKHREAKIDQALIVQNLYNQSDSSKAFQAALEEKGLTLARGDRRGFVLVDQDGKISSLSRQLKDQRAKDIKARLSNIGDLPNAKNLQEERQYFMRDQYETDRQKAIVDAAIEEDKKKQKEGEKPITEPKKLETPGSFAEELDAKRKHEEKDTQKSLRKQSEIRAFYGRENYLSQIEELQNKLGQTKGSKERLRLQEKLKNLEKILDDIDRRMREQGVEAENKPTSDYSFTRQNPDDMPSKTEREEDFDSRMNERDRKRKEKGKGRNDLPGLDFS